MTTTIAILGGGNGAHMMAAGVTLDCLSWLSGRAHLAPTGSRALFDRAAPARAVDAHALASPRTQLGWQYAHRHLER